MYIYCSIYIKYNIYDKCIYQEPKICEFMCIIFFAKNFFSCYQNFSFYIEDQMTVFYPYVFCIYLPFFMLSCLSKKNLKLSLKNYLFFFQKTCLSKIYLIIYRL